MVPPRTERNWEGVGTHQHHLARASELKVPPGLSFLISLRTRGLLDFLLQRIAQDLETILDGNLYNDLPTSALI
jgi:hypothetical protein